MKQWIELLLRVSCCIYFVLLILKAPPPKKNTKTNKQTKSPKIPSIMFQVCVCIIRNKTHSTQYNLCHQVE
jgi:hypothetical protein